MTHTASRFQRAFTKSLICALMMGLLAAEVATAQAGETITFDGSKPSLLKPDPVYSIPNSLFPAASLTDNKVTVTGGNIGGAAFGGLTESGNVSDNSVDVSGDAVMGNSIYGGYTILGNAYNNSIVVSGGQVNDLTGGETQNGNANNNSVVINGGKINNFVYGGYSWTGGNANNNSVVINAGEFNFNTIYGGASQQGDAINNSITLSGKPDLTLVTLVGGWSSDLTKDTFTGNTLHVRGFSGMVNGVYNFEKYNFYLSKNIASGDTVLTVVNTIDLTGTTTNIAEIYDGSRLAVGDKVILIDGLGGITGAPTNTSTSAVKGISLLYTFKLTTNPDNVYGTLKSITLNPQTKALAEGRAGGMAFINQGADMAAGQGMNSALTATGGTTGTGGFAGFGAMSGGSSRYNTGSHVDVDGFSLMTGLGWRAPVPAGSLLLGTFFEAGWGNYDSHNSFSNAASVKGGGDTEYYGGGILARYDLTQGTLKGLYTEASLRAGWATTDFSSSDLRSPTGRKASYDSGAAYYGAHAGLGYVWQMSDAASLDFSTKYLWTHQDSDNVTVAGDPIKFKATDSHRWRNGVRFNYAVTEQFTPYIGTAYEHEFDGKASATAYGRNIKAPTLEGGTGIGELGVTFKPLKGIGFSADLGVQGYIGVREGVTGSFQLKYEF